MEKSGDEACQEEFDQIRHGFFLPVFLAENWLADDPQACSGGESVPSGLAGTRTGGAQSRRAFGGRATLNPVEQGRRICCRDPSAEAPELVQPVEGAVASSSWAQGESAPLREAVTEGGG